MKKFRTEKGHLAIAMSADELMAAQNSDYVICDNCASPEADGVYVPVLNRWLCMDCYAGWVESAVYYPEDEEYELRCYNRMLGLLGEPDGTIPAKL